MYVGLVLVMKIKGTEVTPSEQSADLVIHLRGVHVHGYHPLKMTWSLRSYFWTPSIDKKLQLQIRVFIYTGDSYRCQESQNTAEKCMPETRHRNQYMCNDYHDHCPSDDVIRPIESGTHHAISKKSRLHKQEDRQEDRSHILCA